MMTVDFYTYLHCKPNGDPFYVGKGCARRSHQLKKRRSLHHQNIVAKYGANNIRVYVFPCFSEQEAFGAASKEMWRLRRQGD